MGLIYLFYCTETFEFQFATCYFEEILSPPKLMLRFDSQCKYVEGLGHILHNYGLRSGWSKINAFLEVPDCGTHSPGLVTIRVITKNPSVFLYKLPGLEDPVTVTENRLRQNHHEWVLWCEHSCTCIYPVHKCIYISVELKGVELLGHDARSALEVFPLCHFIPSTVWQYH